MNGWADVVLVVHALIALGIVFGLLAIWLGAGLGWAWVRNPLWRGLHLAAIGVVAGLAALGMDCPLTVLEDRLRGGAPVAEGFVQRWVARLLYYDLPAWVFTVVYVFFALLVCLTWWWVPVRRRRRKSA